MPKVRQSKSVDSLSHHSSDDEIQSPIKSPVKIDAFKFLMQSRNKSIGTNSPGKERQETKASPSEQADQKRKLKKRKLELEEWAEKKGRSKKKVLDEVREQQIEKQMQKRAKRLKEMLSIDTPGKLQGNQSETRENSDSDGEIFPRRKSVSGETNLNKTEQNRDGYFLENGRKEKSKKLMIKHTRISTKRKRKCSLSLKKSKSHDHIELNTPISQNQNSTDISKRTLSENEHLSSTGRLRTPWKMRVKLFEKENFEDHSITSKDISKLVVSSDDEDCFANEVIILPEKSAMKKPVKLAPIFLQNQKKQNLNDRTSKITNSQNRELEEGFYCSYPEISHVQQQTSSLLWNLPIANLPLREESEHFKYGISNLITCTESPVYKLNKNKKCEVPTQKITSLTQHQIDEFLDEYQKEYSESPVRNLFETLKELPKEQRRFFVSNEEYPDISVAEENDNIVWSEKYNPISRETIIGNKGNVSKLASWLETWLTPSTKRTRYDSGSSSGNEFVSQKEDEDSKPNPSNVNALLMLLGPYGVGKTSCVYTICENLGVTVIEINASSRRSGKKLLQDLQEATRSHRVRPGDGTEAPLSLLLVEDADIVFDVQDDGFVAALKTLAKTSLRPIVLTASDANCDHLRYFMDNYPVLRFDVPDEREVVLRMKLLCLAENLSVPAEAIEAIVARSRGDVRKALLDVQFWASKSNNFVQFNLATSSENFGGLWWNISQRNLHLTEGIDSLSFADSTNIRRKFETEPTVVPWAQKYLTNSLSFGEDYQLYNDSKEVLKEMVQWILEANLKRNGADLEDITRDTPTSEHLRWRTSLHNIHRELNKIIPPNIQLDRSGLAIDYQSTLRQICRLEYDRHKNNRKRGNRFYHYLRIAGVQLVRDESRILYRTLSSR